ncbi:MAG: hypothetical protein HZC28_08660 [Spirochaetes bacterium]|nr:hypothetical protein [Spirochaetota bacterium]
MSASSLNEYLILDKKQQERIGDMYARYRLLSDDPDSCRPMIIVNTPVSVPVWEDRLADPLVMLKAELDAIRPHLEIGDDRVPSVRVQFGTAQVAAAFGCEMFIPPNNLPAAGSHVLTSSDAVFKTKVPPLNAGWYGKLADWTSIWKKNLPAGVHIQHPDIQSAFNSAHLIRGNDILLDFYDAPEAVSHLLDTVTDFMIAITEHLKSMISDDTKYFFDWGSMWKGAARISNCSMHLISPEWYREHVFPRDVRFFKALGGGRMHYCGSYGEVIDEFFKVPSITGLDFDIAHHDFHAICAKAPEHVVITATGGRNADHPFIKRLLSGDWPKKRNIIIPVNAASVEEGKKILEALRKSIP